MSRLADRATSDRLGAALGDLRCPARDGLRALSACGFGSVELSARGELSPEMLDRTGRRDLRRFLDQLGLKAAALEATATNMPADAQVDHAARAVEMAVDLDIDVVTVALADLGATAAGLTDEGQAALERIVDRVDVTGRWLAVGAPQMKPDALHALIVALHHPRVRALVDTGGWTRRGVDARQGLLTLADHVELVRLRDAEAGDDDQLGAETPIGEGDVDFPEVLRLLRDLGYRRPAIVRRWGAPQPAEEFAAARTYLQDVLDRI